LIQVDLNEGAQRRDFTKEGNTLLLAFSGIRVFLLMRWIGFFLFVASPLISFAQDSSLDSLPQAVRETIEMEKGDGVAKKAETYTWGDVTIYTVEIDLDNIPSLELQIAENGKLIRVDRLQPEKEDDGGDDDD
jgi:hypothetical protein